MSFIGRISGYETWITSNDRNRTYLDEPIGFLSLQDLPDLGVGSNVNSMVVNIDVLGLGKNKVIPAFEGKHTTDIHSGLARLDDLVLAATI